MRIILVTVLLAACGGGGSGTNSDAPVKVPDGREPDARAPDASPPDALVPDAFVPDAFVPIVDAAPDASVPGSCDPLAQTGCGAGEKCTSLVDGGGSYSIGCAPDGTQAMDAVCDPATAATGHDACVRGTVCVSHRCEAICDLNGATPACDAQHACSRYSEVLDVGGVAVAGLCDAKCDPLTQASLGEPACGSVQPAMPARGCYSPDLVTFGCAGAIHLDKTDRVPAAETNGVVYTNSCAPGYLALLYESTNSFVISCIGLCAPHDADSTKPQWAAGDPTVVVKLPLDPAPVAGHGVCAPGAKGSEANQDCRYLRSILFDGAGDPVDSEYADTVGFCYGLSHYQYDANGDGVNDTTIPSCAALPPRTAATTGLYDDAEDWGCEYSGPHHHPGAHPTVRVPERAVTLTRYRIER